MGNQWDYKLKHIMDASKKGMREGGEHKKISGLIILCHRCVILCNRSIISLTDLFIIFPSRMPFLESSKKCFTL